MRHVTSESPVRIPGLNLALLWETELFGEEDFDLYPAICVCHKKVKGYFLDFHWRFRHKINAPLAKLSYQFSMQMRHDNGNSDSLTWLAQFSNKKNTQRNIRFREPIFTPPAHYCPSRCLLNIVSKITVVKKLWENNLSRYYTKQNSTLWLALSPKLPCILKQCTQVIRIVFSFCSFWLILHLKQQMFRNLTKHVKTHVNQDADHSPPPCTSLQSLN